MIAVLAFTLRFALAIVLAVAAVAKARSFGAFVRTVDAVVPWQRTARTAAAAVIAVEATLAVLLAAGVWVNAVSLATLALFLGFAASALLLVESPTLKTAFLLAVAVWGFCRFYYFAFYVIEHYVDPGYKFAGLTSFVRYLLRRRRPAEPPDAPEPPP